LRGIYLEITSTISTRPNTSSTREFTIQIFWVIWKFLTNWIIVIFYLFFKWENREKMNYHSLILVVSHTLYELLQFSYLTSESFI
jgi:ABC-type xylose transport system permease subunit